MPRLLRVVKIVCFLPLLIVLVSVCVGAVAISNENDDDGNVVGIAAIDVSTATRTEIKSAISRDSKIDTTTARKERHRTNKKRIRIGSLSPKDLPGPIIFTNWEPSTNQTMTLQHAVSSESTNNKSIQLTYASGSVPRRFYANTSKNVQDNTKMKSTKRQYITLNDNDKTNTSTGADVSFSVISSLMSTSEVNSILELLKKYDKLLDDDPDTVDSMPTYEIFVNTPTVNDIPDPKTPKYRDILDHSDRQKLRQKLQAILVPIINERIQPFVQYRYPNLCNKSSHRTCTACYSLLRRYRSHERVSHPPHNDGHAIVTAVTSLSTYNVNYRGGLYVVSPNSVGSNITSTTLNSDGTSRVRNYHVNGIPNNLRYLALNAGDTVVHTSALLHGVKVYDTMNQPERTERWSWILWFHDNGNDCKADHSKEWYEDCAKENDPICQQIYATKLDTDEEKLLWNIRAAQNGASLSAVKVARAYLHAPPKSEANSGSRNTRSMSFDVQKAMNYYKIAIDTSNDPEAHYGIAEIVLKSIKAEESNQLQTGVSSVTDQWKRTGLLKAMYHLECAAMAGHVLAMFNLGIAHTFGYGVYDNEKQPRINQTLAVEWFIQSGLPEGYYVAAVHAQSVGNIKQHETYSNRAKTLGFGQPWRPIMRQQTGSGVLGNVDINLDWPVAFDGRIPPKF